jgi:hypothetical protein
LDKVEVVKVSVLGSLGQLYMFVLLVLLFLGSGFALWSFINFILNRNKQKAGTTDKKPALNQENGSNRNNNSQKMIGGLFMNNNGWLKLAVFSFIGILVSVIILGFVSTSNPSAMSIHQQHQQQGNMNMQGGMNVNTPMGDMQMQGGMNGNMGMQYGNVQQQLSQIQQQINQLQQQLNNGGMGNMQQGGSSNMGGMGMMGGMMGGMGNMQQNSGSMSMM